MFSLLKGAGFLDMHPKPEDPPMKSRLRTLEGLNLLPAPDHGTLREEKAQQLDNPQRASGLLEPNPHPKLCTTKRPEAPKHRLRPKKLWLRSRDVDLRLPRAGLR